MPNPRGHVFVVHGDVTTMAVDAWILPTDRYARIRSDYWGVRGSDAGERRPDFSSDFRDGRAFAEQLPWESDSPGVPICTAVPDAGLRTVDDLRPRLRSGLRLAAAVAKARSENESKSENKNESKSKSDKRVARVALPTFGTKGGGGGRLVGALLQSYLDLAHDCAAEYDIDVVIACLNRASYHGLQILRCGHDAATSWPALSESKRTHAIRLAQAARAGGVTPFIGSGVSVTSGLPDWAELLETLRAAAGLDDVPQDQFEKLTTLDRADLLETVLGPGLKQRIAQVTTATRIGLPPMLLASLPGREAVTLNYDTLFEEARTAQQTPLTVLPGGTVDSGTSWLLKLHGSIDRPQDIVLTRQDYLAYAQSRSALSSLAVSLLMTRHLLFVGFGFTDDHFHQLLHEVRGVHSRAEQSGTDGAQSLGTALMLGHDTVRERLWNKHVEIITFDEGGSMPANGRLLEIFLDMLVAHAVEAPTYFLRPQYDGMLTDAERQLAEAFEKLMTTVDHEHIRPSVRNAFAQLYHQLGAPDEP